MSDTLTGPVNTKVSPVVRNKVHDTACDWLELDFFASSQRLKGQISCPAGMRILDMLNSPDQGDGKEILDLHSFHRNFYTGESNPAVVQIEKGDILFITAPDVNLGRGLGAKGEFKVYPMVPKTKIRVNIKIGEYAISGTLFRGENETLADVLNNRMFFLPMTYALISKNGQMFGDRPFVAINKRQIDECREDHLFSPPAEPDR